MRVLILLALVSAFGGVALAQQYPQGYNVYFYFWSVLLNGRLSNGECCDLNTATICPASCDVHFVVCVREHNETSNFCNSTTSSHVTFFSYAWLNSDNLTFSEGNDVFGTGLHNPLNYSFAGNWSKHIQTVLIARDYDLDTYDFYSIDYVTTDWIVPGEADVDERTYDGYFDNIMVRVGLSVECWEGWYGEYCTIFCVSQDAPGGHYTCLENGTAVCLENWVGVDCNFLKGCTPSCDVSRVCYNGSCDNCSQGYAGDNCTCIENHICDPAGGHCDIPCENGGTCVGGACSCTSLYTGIDCSQERDICGTVISPSQCPSGQGVCSNSLEAPNGFICTCVAGYTGTNCDVNVDDCVNSPCGAMGQCVDEINGYECVCNDGFSGENCEVNIDECQPNPCLNGGVCTEGDNNYTCSCSNGYTGLECETEVYPGYPQGYNVFFYIWSVLLNGRLSNGECCDFTNATICPASCDVHFVVCVREHNETSNFCNSTTSSHITFFSYAYVDRDNLTFTEGDNIFGTGIHNPVPYAFAGNWSKHIQTVLIVRDYDLVTYDFYSIDYVTTDWIVPGEADVDERTYDGYYNNIMVRVGLSVVCWEGWYGEYCTIFCVSQDSPGGHYTCLENGTAVCLENWVGVDCNFLTVCTPSCDVSRVCYNRSCDNCSQGYAGDNCTCIENHICDPTGGHCDIPCENGGTCMSGACSCTFLYTGIDCSQERDICGTVISPSQCPSGQGVCSNSLEAPNGFICTCVAGYTGTNCDVNIDDCVNSPCGAMGQCVDEINGYECVCNVGFSGENCEVNIDECQPNPCLNGGVCTEVDNNYTCSCSNGYTGLECETEVYPGYPQGYNVFFHIWSVLLNGRLSNGECCDFTNATICPASCDVHFVVCVREHNETSNLCNSITSSHITFSTTAYLDRDNLTFTEGDNIFGTGIPNPILYAFAGNWSKHIQTVLIVRDYDLVTYAFYSIDYVTTDWIVPGEADVDERTYDGYFDNIMVRVGLSVVCWEGWYGEYCTIFCVSQDAPGGHYTCLENGTAVCLENWVGVDCNFLTVCTPSCDVSRVCYNGSCDNCSQGYAGDNCTCIENHICDPTGGHCDIPCENGGTCMSGACSCAFLYTGIDCSQERDICETVISPSQCPSGQGVCSNSLEVPNGFICTCVAGYTGTNCDVNIDDCVNSPCGAMGQCVDEINGYECVCNVGFSGENCEVNIDECQPNPCLNGGVCAEGDNNYTCSCSNGYTGLECETEVECTRATCSDHGDCELDTSQSAVCTCDNGYTGVECDSTINTCDPNPCPQGSTCVQGIGSYACVCENSDCGNINEAVAIQIPQTALIAGGMGIIIGVLLFVVVCVLVIAVCIARRKKSSRHGGIRTEHGTDGINNPIYDEGTLPTYEDLDKFQKNTFPDKEPEYEIMDNLKVDLANNLFQTVNMGYEDEKAALENMYK